MCMCNNNCMQLCRCRQCLLLWQQQHSVVEWSQAAAPNVVILFVVLSVVHHANWVVVQVCNVLDRSPMCRARPAQSDVTSAHVLHNDTGDVHLIHCCCCCCCCCCHCWCWLSSSSFTNYYYYYYVLLLTLVKLKYNAKQLMPFHVCVMLIYILNPKLLNIFLYPIMINHCVWEYYCSY